MEQNLQRVNANQRVEVWGQRIVACRNSGMTVREWCSQEGLSEKTYYYWQRKLYQMVLEESTFVEIMDCHESCDLRLLHVLYQHKILWLERVKYLRNNNYVSAGIGEELTNMASRLVQRADILRKYAIKYDLTGRTNILSEMLALLSEIKGMDQALCKKS